MLDSISIGTSGLQTFSAGLKVISNNVANLNTPGFKASTTTFSNLYVADADPGGGGLDGQTPQGGGVTLSQTSVNFRVGELRQTGNPLDLNIDGEGFFITRKPGDEDPVYTRAGQFEFDRNGVLVVRGTDRQVIGLDASGAQTAITLEGLRINAPKPTSKVDLTGNLSSSATDFSLSGVKVIDAAGGEHTLSLRFAPKAGAAGTWTVTASDGASEVGSGEVQFASGHPVPGFDAFTISYAPSGVPVSDIKVDLSGDVTNFDTGSNSTLAVGTSDGVAVGTLSKVAFEADGSMTVSYSNGQTAKGTRVALALFDSNARLVPQDDSGFTYPAHEGLRAGAANQGGFGSIGSNQIEGSNVDLASEFSDLIVAQRGYQASSRIVSTANDMLQDLLDMKGQR